MPSGIDAITTGNHVWKKKEIIPVPHGRAAGYPAAQLSRGTPGFGYTVIRKNDMALCVANIEGRIFMNPLDCPFRAMEEFLEEQGSADTRYRRFSRGGDVREDSHGMVPRRQGGCADGNTHPCADCGQQGTAERDGLHYGRGHDRPCGFRHRDGEGRRSGAGSTPRCPRNSRSARTMSRFRGFCLPLSRTGNTCLDITRIKEKIAGS